MDADTVTVTPERFVPDGIESVYVVSLAALVSVASVCPVPLTLAEITIDIAGTVPDSVALRITFSVVAPVVVIVGNADQVHEQS